MAERAFIALAGKLACFEVRQRYFSLLRNGSGSLSMTHEAHVFIDCDRQIIGDRMRDNAGRANGVGLRGGPDRACGEKTAHQGSYARKAVHVLSPMGRMGGIVFEVLIRLLGLRRRLEWF